MKSIFSTFFLLLITDFSSAQQTCPLPEQKVVIFFGNGINTTRPSATAAFEALSDELGMTYNGQTLHYDVAYNKTSGIAPNWFNQWYQQFMLASINVIADEVLDHVDKYSAAICHGQKVVVVAHSQGNLYVNEAKIQLAQQLSAKQMQSFAIFGVTVPANNVGGNSGPYYTNHRDFIHYVPRALSQNWTLQRSNGTSADDIGLIQAHLFNDTYMSTDFDVRPAVLIGIKGQIGGAETPTPSCDNYRNYFGGALAGIYPVSCNGENKTVTVNTEAVVTLPNVVIDLSADPNSPMTIDRKRVTDSFDWARIDFLGANEFLSVFMSWTIASAKLTTISKRLPIFVQGVSITIGEQVWDLSAGRNFEFVSIHPANLNRVPDYEPQFNYTKQGMGGDTLKMQYKQFRGLTSFVYNSPGSSLICNL